MLVININCHQKLCKSALRYEAELWWGHNIFNLTKLIVLIPWLNVLEYSYSRHTTRKILMHSFRSKTHILGIFTPFRCSKTYVRFRTTPAGLNELDSGTFIYFQKIIFWPKYILKVSKISFWAQWSKINTWATEKNKRNL